MSFTQLGLSEPLLRAVADLGYENPTPIQLQAIPVVLKGGDLMAGAQTGTGKTAGFTLPLLERLSQAPARTGKPVIRALVLTPTRELAAQVEESVRDYGKYLKLKSMMMFGGVGINPQIDQLRRGVDILVATPGRLLDHMQQGTVDLSHVEILVLDEADRMLDMGFIRDIKKVLAKLPPRRQNLLFSATFSDDIKALAAGLLDSPQIIEVARRNTTAQTVDQKVYLVDRERKRELLTKLIRDHNWFQVLVFTRTKHGANRLAEQLDKDGIKALAIHGNKSQSARTRALSEFKDATLQVLVATDIAARGIDIDQLPHVVNFDLPNVPEDYVHRIGRTGRAGSTGEALSLVCIDEKQLLIDIEKLIGRSFPKEIVPGFEPDPSIKAEPIQKRGDRSGGGGGRGQPRSPQAAAPRASHAQGQNRAPRGEAGAGRSGANGGGSGRNASGNGSNGNSGGNSGANRTDGASRGANGGGNGRRPAPSAGARSGDVNGNVAPRGERSGRSESSVGSSAGSTSGSGAQPRSHAPRNRPGTSTSSAGALLGGNARPRSGGNRAK